MEGNNSERENSSFCLADPFFHKAQNSLQSSLLQSSLTLLQVQSALLQIWSLLNMFLIEIIQYVLKLK